MLTTTDDRGKSCGITALSRRQVGVRAMGLRVLTDPHTRRELAITDKLELACAIGGGVVAAVIWQLAWLKLPVLGLVGLCGGFTVIPPVAGAIAWRLTLGTVRRRRFRRLVEVYLSTGRCASCGYMLAGLAMEGDGCVVCPECGAAWRAERIGVEESDRVGGESER